MKTRIIERWSMTQLRALYNISMEKATLVLGKCHLCRKVLTNFMCAPNNCRNAVLGAIKKGPHNHKKNFKLRISKVGQVYYHARRCYSDEPLESNGQIKQTTFFHLLAHHNTTDQLLQKVMSLLSKWRHIWGCPILTLQLQ